MDFKNWLKNEALWSPPAVPLGKEDFLKKQNYNVANRFQPLAARVDFGKGIEGQIFDALVKCGMKLRKATAKEDMYDKIDAWWNTGSGEEAVQIKYRDTGEDLLFEVMKDYYRKIPGRDMIGKATYYAVLRRNGEIVVVSINEAKKIIQNALNMIQQQGFDQNNTFKIPAGNSFAFFRIRPDPRSGQDKLMAYIPISAFKNIRPPCKSTISNMRA